MRIDSASLPGGRVHRGCLRYTKKSHKIQNNILNFFFAMPTISDTLLTEGYRHREPVFAHQPQLPSLNHKWTKPVYSQTWLLYSASLLPKDIQTRIYSKNRTLNAIKYFAVQYSILYGSQYYISMQLCC